MGEGRSAFLQEKANELVVGESAFPLLPVPNKLPWLMAACKYPGLRCAEIITLNPHRILDVYVGLCHGLIGQFLILNDPGPSLVRR